MVRLSVCLTLALALPMLPFNKAHGMSLKDAVETTLQTNPNVLASEFNVEAAEDVVRQAQAGYLPSVDLVLAGGEETSNNPTTRAANVENLRLTREE